MNVIHAAVHQIQKSQGTKGATVVTTNAELSKGSALTALVQKLRETYEKRSAQKQGVFQANTDSFPFRGMFDDYDSSACTFLDFTKRAVNHLKSEVEDVIFAAGGYVFFAEYEEQARRFLFVAKLTESAGQAFDLQAAAVVLTTHLTTERLQQAARLNISAYGASKGNYLNFVNARESHEASDYFVAFIGCDVQSTARGETERLVNVVRRFAKSKALAEVEADSFKQRVHTHVMAKVKAKAAISLLELANEAWPSAPEEFIGYLNEQEDRPNDEFTPTRGPVQDLVRYSYSTTGFSITLTREFARAHKMQYYDNTLIIRDLPDNARSYLTDADE